MGIDSEPTPALQDIIVAEIYKEGRQNEAENLGHFLNNFPNKIPGSNGLSFSDLWRVGRVEKEGDNLESYLSQRRIDRFKEPNESSESYLKLTGESKRRAFGTEQQFRDDIQTAIETSGVDKKVLTEYIDQHKEDSKSPASNSRRDYEIVKRLILPVYIKLREMGYNHTDMYQ